MRQRRTVILISLLATTVAAYFGILARRGESSQTQAQAVLNIPPDIPLRATAVSASATPSGSGGIQYTVVNRGGARLTALEVSWQLHFANGSTPRVVQRTDYLLSAQGQLAPGDSGHFQVGKVTNAKPGMEGSPLASAEGAVTYAEFADGTRSGSDVQRASAYFTACRAAEMQEYAQVLRDYRQGGVNALNEALSWKHLPAIACGRAAWLQMHQDEENKGVTGLVKELERLTALKMPGQ